MRCKQCGCEIPKSKLNCPNCDFYIYDDPNFVREEQKNQKIIGIGVAAALVLIVGWFMLMSPPAAKMHVLGTEISLKMRYKPLKQCVVAEARALGLKKERERCGVSFFDYMKMRGSLKGNMKNFENLFS